MTIQQRKRISRSTTPGARHDVPPVDITPVAELPSLLAALIYGRSGTGKTTFLSTFPKPLLLLDIREKGTDSVANVQGVEVAKIEDFQQLIDVYWYLQKGRHKYKSVGIDQVTAMQDQAIAHAMRDSNKDPNGIIAKRDWGNAAGLMKQWLTSYRDLIECGMNVAFLGHDRTRDIEDGDDDQLEPLVNVRVMPSVASHLNAMVKVIGNTFIRETFTVENKRRVRHVDYCMRVGPHAFYTTKVRSPVGVSAPDIIVDPSYDKMVAVMKGTYSDQATTSKRK